MGLIKWIKQYNHNKRFKQHFSQVYIRLCTVAFSGIWRLKRDVAYICTAYFANNSELYCKHPPALLK